jgi:hypothetical protein
MGNMQFFLKICRFKDLGSFKVRPWRAAGNLKVRTIKVKANANCERLFKLFCEEQNADHVRLLLHTEVRWLSKGNCLKRFMELFDTLSDFLSDKPEMKYLLTVNGKAFVSYLAYIFENLNISHNQLQGTNTTLVDAKAKIFGFITFIELCQKHIHNKNFEKFHWLQKCEVTNCGRTKAFRILYFEHYASEPQTEAS